MAVISITLLSFTAKAESHIVLHVEKFSKGVCHELEHGKCMYDVHYPSLIGNGI